MHAWKPLLQIIHISDLHLCDSYNEKAAKFVQSRGLRLVASKLIKGYDPFNLWHEGTLRNDEVAADCFEMFLKDMAKRERSWLGRGDVPGTAQTWLVDTGDATTFGDEGSMRAALQRLQRWQGLLGNCHARLLFGNHDAWTGDQPFFDSDYARAIVAQRRRIVGFQQWRPAQWLPPLRIAASGGALNIECYALNSVTFRQWKNTRAQGYVSPGSLGRLRDTIDRTSRRGSYRILLMHHPLTFPYTLAEQMLKLLVPMWELGNAARVAKALGCNDKVLSRGDGQPYIHLFLSGHTHVGFPAGQLPENVLSIEARHLSQGQLQLVAGPLMLLNSQAKERANRDPHAASASPEPVADEAGVLSSRRSSAFSLSSVCDANQQFQVLRFYHSKDHPGQLQLERKVYMRTPASGGFVERAAWTSKTRVFC